MVLLFVDWCDVVMWWTAQQSKSGKTMWWCYALICCTPIAFVTVSLQYNLYVLYYQWQDKDVYTIRHLANALLVSWIGKKGRFHSVTNYINIALWDLGLNNKTIGLFPNYCLMILSQYSRVHLPSQPSFLPLASGMRTESTKTSAVWYIMMMFSK